MVGMVPLFQIKGYHDQVCIRLKCGKYIGRPQEYVPRGHQEIQVRNVCISKSILCSEFFLSSHSYFSFYMISISWYISFLLLPTAKFSMLLNKMNFFFSALLTNTIIFNNILKVNKVLST